MQFRVSAIPAAVTNPPPPSRLAPNWTTTSNMIAQVVRTNRITLDFWDDGGGLYPGLPFNPDPDGPGYFALINMKPFEFDVNDFPVAGDTEMWEIVNLTGESHPIHIHLLDFRIVNRQRLSSGGTNIWSGNRTNPPAMVIQYVQDRTNHTLKSLGYYLSTNASELNLVQPFESGPKDVVHAAPFAVTRIVMSWPTNKIFYSTPSARSGDPETKGRYIYRCHILDHEDNDMMRPLQLLSPMTQGMEWISRAQAHGLGGAPVGDPFRAGRALRLRTQPGLAYELQWSRELEPPTWESSARFIGSGSPVDIELPPSAEPSGFLRLRAVALPGN